MFINRFLVIVLFVCPISVKKNKKQNETANCDMKICQKLNSLGKILTLYTHSSHFLDIQLFTLSTDTLGEKY